MKQRHFPRSANRRCCRCLFNMHQTNLRRLNDAPNPKPCFPQMHHWWPPFIQTIQILANTPKYPPESRNEKRRKRSLAWKQISPSLKYHLDRSEYAWLGHVALWWLYDYCVQSPRLMQLDVTQSMLPIRSRPSEMWISPLSRSFLGLFSSNSFSTSIYVHYTWRGVLPFVQLYSEVKII